MVTVLKSLEMSSYPVDFYKLLVNLHFFPDPNLPMFFVNIVAISKLLF